MGELTPELAHYRDEIREIAANYGLDFYEVIFELVDHDELNMIAAYGGFPTRYPHWRFGMEYEQLSKSYQWGLSKIYELVINNDPCYAYLMRSNSLTDQKLVMAHVYGHCDFFKNNEWFSKTPRKMMDITANHGSRIRRYMDRFGVDRVERFIDRVQALDNLIDIHSPFIKRDPGRAEAGGESESESEIPRIQAKDYMDRYINPPDYLAAQRKAAEAKRRAAKRFPPRPIRDVLRFLLDHAPLEPWQQDVLDMLRDEAYYFAPQGMTKIMNEGWAVYWHSTIMTRHIVEASEVIHYADAHSGTLATAPGQINPYKLGVELFRHIEHRWDVGKFGPEYERCDDPDVRRRWNRPTNEGREKIFQVRKVYNDVSFIDCFIDEEFAEQQKLYVYGVDQATGRYVVVDRDWRKVKRRLLDALTNFGNPIIYVMDANFGNRGELYLYHDWMGADLQFEAALQTLRYVQRMWKRPVHLETREEGQPRLLSYDGKETSMREISASQPASEVVGVAPEENDD
ncbi:MAG: SpoVR family protein [Planctomycetes bacterium]|nr:SpoVR family protein [Planctomycetota bacterium]